jgi:predicted phosphoribosyltransferase
MLADELLALQLPDPAALALPRGGVPVAVEIAEAL